MNASVMTYGVLLLAIVCETVGTSCLKQSEQCTRLVPTLCAFGTYALAFYLLSFTLKSLPVGIAYAIWSGLGIVLISLIGFVFFKQQLDTAACIGIALILAGVVVVNCFSRSVAH